MEDKTPDKVFGFKIFNKDFTNRYHKKFKVGKSYQVKGEIKWGPDGNGFHMCTVLQDCFRFFEHQEVIVTRVIGSGRKICRDYEYCGNLDMYVCEKLKVLEVIPWSEVLTIILELTDYKELVKFLSCVTLTEEEFELFKKHYQNRPMCLDNVIYYQDPQKRLALENEKK